MKIFDIYTPKTADELARALFTQERKEKQILNGWFLSREIAWEATQGQTLSLEDKAAAELEAVIDRLPLELSQHAIFAGTQRDAFAASYALINPAFTVESFRGYCDPLEVYNFATATDEISAQRIAAMREKAADSDYVRDLAKTYAACQEYTGEVAFFVEQVTGHLVPDFRTALAEGVYALINRLECQPENENINAFRKALRSVLNLARRYRHIALSQLETAPDAEKARLQLIADTLERVPAYGARNLYEAMQSYILLWQVMCIEQAPNPFAFSVGGADKIFQPYMGNLTREEAAALCKHFLVFFNVGSRSWAISQNILLGGKDVQGNDLTCPMTYAFLDAYYEMNLPQPILSVKLHRGTPRELMESLGRFFFTPGCLTPSLFNDDSLFQTLQEHGIDEADLPDYSVAGCQEPLIMGKDSPNTTNSWLNLAKILELTLSGGKSTITGEKIGPQSSEAALDLLKNLRSRFYENLDFYANEMAKAANGASRALSNLRVPFLSCFMGGLESGIDCRDPERQGTKYNGSGCLIHGLSIVADSFTAVDCLLRDRPQDAQMLIDALACNFEGYEELRAWLKACPKFGNNHPVADAETVEVANRVSDVVSGLKNYLGNPFRPDWSSPSTHLLYGYWVGATPDGRGAREMLGYGIDPLYGEAGNGMGFRTLSALKLPYEKFNGGEASHFGIDPKYFDGSTYAEKGVQFMDRVVRPLFFNDAVIGRAPFYLYVNITTAETLRKVLADPKKYAPNGVYIMRIHGTFVNFLDLSPAIQEDIIKRLDPGSTALC